MEQELTTRQAAYINWCDNPPNFYCKKYSNAELPPDNENEARKWYCTKQCFDCMAIVGETRIKNKI